MSKEFDLAGLGSISGWIRLKSKRVNIPEGSPCASCTTILQGQFCHVCGQFAEDMHRSIFKLCLEFIESFFHVDGRVWQTLPKLMLKPGVLTRDYLDGKRAPQIPPFRLFLVTLLLVFFVGDRVRSQNAEVQALSSIEIPSEPLKVQPPQQKDVQSFLDSINPEDKTKNEQAAKKLSAAGEKMHERFSPVLLSVDDTSKWFKDRITAISKDPERFLLVLEIWAYRVAVLSLPITAFLLTLLFIFQRRFFVYDHLVFSTHSLTFHLLLLTTILLLSLFIGSYAWWLALASPVHVWFHMRKVYSTGVFGTLTRMGLLGFGTVIGYSALAIMWIMLGVNAMG